MRENAHRRRGIFHPSTLLASCSGSCCRRFFLGALAWTCPRAQTSYRRRANYTAASGILAGQAPCTLVYGGCGHLLYLAVGCLCGVALHVRAVHASSGVLKEENDELPVGEAGGHVRYRPFSHLALKCRDFALEERELCVQVCHVEPPRAGFAFALPASARDPRKFPFQVP